MILRAGVWERQQFVRRGLPLPLRSELDSEVRWGHLTVHRPHQSQHTIIALVIGMHGPYINSPLLREVVCVPNVCLSILDQCSVTVTLTSRRQFTPQYRRLPRNLMSAASEGRRLSIGGLSEAYHTSPERSVMVFSEGATGSAW